MARGAGACGPRDDGGPLRGGPRIKKVVPAQFCRLREIARVHEMLVRDVVRVQARLESIHRSRMPIVGTPHRFRTKQQFWSYCGLGIVMRSGDERGDFRRPAQLGIPLQPTPRTP
jgi:hypothetical protein